MIEDIRKINKAAFVDGQFYTRKQVAEKLLISTDTLDRMRKRSELPEPVKVANQLRWTGQQLNSWAAKESADTEYRKANSRANVEAIRINEGEKGIYNYAI